MAELTTDDGSTASPGAIRRFEERNSTVPDQTTDQLSGAEKFVFDLLDWPRAPEAWEDAGDWVDARRQVATLATYYEDKGAAAEKLKRAELEREIRYYEHHERKAEEQLDLAAVEKIDNEERSDSTDDSAGQPWSIWMRIKFLRRDWEAAERQLGVALRGRTEMHDRALVAEKKLAAAEDSQGNVPDLIAAIDRATEHLDTGTVLELVEFAFTKGGTDAPQLSDLLLDQANALATEDEGSVA
jgi:hypothetical protein